MLRRPPTRRRPPFFRSVPLAEHGRELVHPDIALAHPLDGGRAGHLHRSLTATIEAAGADGDARERLFGPLTARWDDIGSRLLGPVVRPPRHPISMARFGLHAVRPADPVVRRFQTDEVRGLFAGIATHGFLPPGKPLTTSFALVLGALGPRARATELDHFLAARIDPRRPQVDSGPACSPTRRDHRRG